MRLSFLLVLATCLLLLTAAPAAETMLTLDLGKGVKLELVRIAKGKFRQGSPADENGRAGDETVREVTIGQDFYMGKHPVTRGQFARFVEATGYRTAAEEGPSGGFGLENGKLVQHKRYTWRSPGFPQTDEHPVVLVTHEDAQAFLSWLTKTTKQNCALPTEAQWEYACRAGSTTPFSSGGAEADLAGVCWYKANAGDGTRTAGGKKANAFGLFDMHGNVRQWCRDWYGPYETGPVSDPEETRGDRTKPARRVLRGGSFLTEARHCRAAARGRNTPGSRNADNGFRVMVAVKPGAAHWLPTYRTNGRLLFVNLDPAEIFIGIVCLMFFGGVVFVVVAMIYVQRKRAGTGRVDRPPAVRTTADGFWLNSSGMRSGSVVHYRYRTGGASRTGSTTVTTTREDAFIYTGDTPTDIEILDVVPPQMSGVLDDDDADDIDIPGTSPGTVLPTSSEPASPSPGFPSAY